MAKLMRSVSGIRGIIGDSLTPQVVLSHVRAFLEITQARSIVIGRDSRPTGEMLSQFVSGLCRLSGVSVIDVGLSTTPSVEILVTQLKADAGIIITASHNPLEWNALKFLDKRGIFLSQDDVQKLFALADENKFTYPNYASMGRFEKLSDADSIHLEGVLSLPFIDLEAIRKKRFKVAIDAVNGAGSKIAPKLLEALHCEVVKIHCEPNGTFPRGAEPLPENLGDLCEAVKRNGCMVGFALDPDADRCALVDSNGKSIGEEYTLAIATDEVLSQKRGSVCANLSSSRLTEDVAKKYGCEFSRAKVGEINVSFQMMENNCIIGGEGNGGVILPALHYGRDSLVAMALTLSWMARKSAGPEKFVSENQSYAMPKKKFPLGEKSIQEIFPQIKEAFDGWTFDERDGLWLGNENAWVHVRASNTEPVIRVIAEAITEEEANALCQKIERLL